MLFKKGSTYQIQGKYSCQNRTGIERELNGNRMGIEHESSVNSRSIRIRLSFDSHSIPVLFSLKMLEIKTKKHCKHQNNTKKALDYSFSALLVYFCVLMESPSGLGMKMRVTVLLAFEIFNCRWPAPRPWRGTWKIYPPSLRANTFRILAQGMGWVGPL